MSKGMRVKDLRVILDNMDSYSIVVISSNDHSYLRAAAQVTTVLINECGHITEDYGEGITPEGMYGKRHPALVIS